MRGAVLGCARYPDEDGGGIQNQSTISNIYEDEVLEPLVRCTERKVNAVPKTIIICGRRIRSVSGSCKTKSQGSCPLCVAAACAPRPCSRSLAMCA